MSDFRFGGDSYGINIDWEHQDDDWWLEENYIDFEKVRWVEIDGTRFEKVEE